VLFLCFTDALARHVDRQLEGTTPRARATSLRRFACELIGAAPHETADWEAPRWHEAMRDAVRHLDARPDVVVIDEGQDFEGPDWELVHALTGEGDLWVFHDPHQGFWPDRALPEWVQQAA